MLGISLFQMYWRNWKLTLKTLLMEVFSDPTPTSSGNYKAILETLPAEYECDTPERFDRAQAACPLPSLNPIPYTLAMRRRFGLLALLAAALTLGVLPAPSQAGYNAPIDLTNPRIVPIYNFNQPNTSNPNSEAGFSGFLYSSRIVFSAAHSEYTINSDGSITNSPETGRYVGLPNSTTTDMKGIVRVSKKIISKTYRYDGATLGDFVIYILERDLIQAEPVALLTPEIEKELIASRAEVRMHGYGEYIDRCRAGEVAPCSKKDPRTEQPRSLVSILRTLQEAEGIVGYKRPQLSTALIIQNGKTGFGCGGDSGGSTTTIYQGKLMYLTTTPNGMNGYACGAPPGYDGFGGINYSSPVYEFADIIKEAEEYVAGQVALEKAAADKIAAEKAAIEKATADKAAAEKAALDKIEADRVAAEKAAADKAAADKAKAKPRTIICIKGKVQKKVTAPNPQCPKGFKKK
jgi:hypothetical protein